MPFIHVVWVWKTRDSQFKTKNAFFAVFQMVDISFQNKSIYMYMLVLVLIMLVGKLEEVPTTHL